MTGNFVGGGIGYTYLIDGASWYKTLAAFSFQIMSVISNWHILVFDKQLQCQKKKLLTVAWVSLQYHLSELGILICK